MIARAKGRYLRVAPRKVRLVARMLRGMGVPQARALLQTIPKGAVRPVAKVFESAVANATREGVWTEEQLMVSRIMADEGPMMKRYRSAPMGRAMVIQKKMSHLTIELDAKAGKEVKRGS